MESKISWPVVALFAVFVFGAVTAFVFVPQDAWALIPWESLGGLLVALATALAAFGVGPAVVRRPSVPPPPKNHRGGYADLEAAQWIVAWGVALFAAVWAAARAGLFS